MSVALESTLDPAVPSLRADLDTRIRLAVEAIAIPALALLAAAVIFSLFLLVQGKSPVDFFKLMYTGGFGTWFSLQNTLQRAAPLLLTALCVAIPAQLGLVVIGGEGALVLGGLGAAAIALPLLGLPAPIVLLAMAVAGAVAGALCIGLVGVLRHYRGVNETISSLLIAYIAIAIMNHIVEGPLRDPASLNKPSTAPIGEAYMLGSIPGMDVHWGLVVGIVACLGAWVLMGRTTFGFAARITGGNARAAMLQGLPVGRLMVTACALAGACAGLAGMLEVAAVHGNANASLVAGYGYTGILVAFLARQNPVAIMPVALFFGGIVASGGLIQRRMGLPDATIMVLQGIIFVTILVSETLYGRFRIFQPKGARGMNETDLGAWTVLLAVFAGAIRVGTPFLFVSIGECLTEKSGRINLGLEGTLVLGAMVGYGASYLTGSPWLGVLAAGIAGTLFGALHGWICKFPKVNDVAIGIAMMLLGTGLAFYFGKPFIQPSAPMLPSIPLGAWSDLQQVRSALDINALFFVGIAVAVAMWWAFANTKLGLVVRMTGDSADAARAMGYSVDTIRLAATAVGGFLAGVGGAYLSLYYPGSWNERLSSGQGLMAVALVIFARWNPLYCFLAALLFGGAGALGPALQAVGVTGGYYLFYAAPYVLTLLIMILTSSATGQLKGAPAELSITK